MAGTDEPPTIPAAGVDIQLEPIERRSISALGTPEDVDADIEAELLLPHHLRRYGSSVQQIRKHKNTHGEFQMGTGFQHRLDEVTRVVSTLSSCTVALFEMMPCWCAFIGVCSRLQNEKEEVNQWKTEFSTWGK